MPDGSLDLAPVGLEITEEQRNQARLAGAVRAYHPDLLAALDLQKCMVENLEAATPKLDIVQSDHGGSRGDERQA